MNEEIKSLMESLRRGNYEDPSEKISLLAAALREHQADTAFLLSLLVAPQVPLRLAGLEACLERKEEELHEPVARLARDRETRVRVKAVEALASFPESAVVREALTVLTRDSEGEVRSAVLKATSGRAAFLNIQQSLLGSDSDWNVRLAAAGSLGGQKDPRVAGALFNALANDSDSDVRQQCAELLERFLVAAPEQTRKHLPGDIGALNKAERKLQHSEGAFPKLLEWLRSRTRVAADPQALAQFGTNLTELAANGLLPHAHCAGEACRSVIKMIHREPWKSIVLLGESGVGKSALVNELTYQLAKPENGGWIVLRVSPTDFMTGTKYLGEWETRVSDLMKAVCKPRRVLVYVPNLPDLAAMGRWSKSDANIATAMAPYLEDGKLILLGETTPAEFERGLGATPSLQRLFDKVMIPESDAPDTLEVLRGIRQESGIVIGDEDLVRLQEVSDYFLGHLRRPGNAATLLRFVIGDHAAVGTRITFQDILTALSRSSGVPTKLLDDRVALEIDDVRTFFDKRIMGQPEAVNAMVDLVTLIKAGLTDPHKPFGVFLFVGPTGVGKTELAKALAEFIFGDVKRLLRFDMSEFSSPDGFQRLIGGRGENGLLTDAIRQQPFSVVLLDEIEKSHVNVFDLCLQLFDAGRLTDGRGRLIDFRRTIVILTSNIGAQGATAAPVGFGAASAASEPTVNQERTWRELSRFFRPEFLNRIDRIVHFNPLSLEVAERIAQREIDLVLQRAGIARRGLKIHVDATVTAMLVREGYSPNFGARPLKRTVEQQLLVPLARAIASGQSGDDRVMTVIVENGKIVLRRARRMASPVQVQVAKAANPESAKRLTEMRERLATLETRLLPLRDRKSELLAKTSEPGFYQNEPGRAATFDEIQKLEHFLESVETLNRAFESAEHQLTAQRGKAAIAAHSEKLDSLFLDVSHAETIARAVNAIDLADALVMVSLVDREGKPIEGVEQLATMFQQFANRRRLSAEFLVEIFNETKDHACLSVSGLGASLLFKPEAGMHQMKRRLRHASPRNGREKTSEDSELIRVEVFPVTEPDKKFVTAVSANVQELKPRRTRLIPEAGWQVRLFHAPSVMSLDTWTGGSRTEALNRGMQVLHAQVRAASTNSVAEVIRHYDLGIGSRIRDNRSGRTTNRLAQFFKGRLELVRAIEA